MVPCKKNHVLVSLSLKLGLVILNVCISYRFRNTPSVPLYKIIFDTIIVLKMILYFGTEGLDFICR